MHEWLNSEGLAEKFVKRGGWLYLFSFIIGPLGYVIKIVLSGDLSVSEIGLMYGVLSFIILLWSFNDLGMVESLNYFVPKSIANKEFWVAKAYLLYAMAIMAVSSLLLAGIILLAVNFLSTHYFGVPEATFLLQTFVVFLVLSNIFHFVSTIFNISQDTKLSKGVEMLRLILTLLFVGILHFGNMRTLEYYSWTWNAAIFVTLFFAIYACYAKYLSPFFKKAPAAFSKPVFMELMKYGLWSVLTANVGVILSQIDMQLLLVLKGTEEAGYYSNYLSLIGIPFLFTSPIIAFLFPVISSFHGKSDFGTITKIHSTFSRYFAIIGIMATIIIFLFGNEAWAILFGEKFRRSGEILLYSAPFIIFNLLLQINFQVLAGMWEVKKRLRILVIGLVINAILNLLLIPPFGAEGSALAVWISWIPIWILSSRLTRKFHENFDWKNFGYNAFASALLGALLYFALRGNFSEFTKLEMIATMGLSSGLFVLLFLFINKSDTKLLLSTLKNR